MYKEYIEIYADQETIKSIFRIATYLVIITDFHVSRSDAKTKE